MKLIILSVLFCLSTFAFSQETKDPELAKNEVKINAAYLLAGFPEFSYCRILNNESALGISIAFSIDTDIYYNFFVTPYYRFYFGKKRAGGFFIEGNVTLFSEESVIGTDEFGFGGGFSIGGKLISESKKWTGELLFGIGRNFVNTDIIDEDYYPRVGISVGRRF